MVFLGWALRAVAADEPEHATGWHQNYPTIGSQQAVVTAHPWATRAAWVMLEAGGTAMDAAVAAQAVLTLVEPQSSGIGGGAFLLHYAAGEGRLRAYDGRETAPAALRPDAFLAPDGTPLAWWDVVASGRSVGTPGVLAMLAQAHGEHGRLPWAELFRPAIGLARGGVAVSRRLELMLRSLRHPALARPGAARDYFFAGGVPLFREQTLRNPALAQTLSIIAKEGSRAFYEGPIGQDLVTAVQAQGGSLTMADLAAYRPVERAPLCAPFRSYRVCSFGPPSSGGIALLQILGMWQALHPSPIDPVNETAIHQYVEVLRLVFADRDAYVADPDFTQVPVAALLAPAYLRQRAATIGVRALGRAAPGLGLPASAGQTPELPSTTHLSIVDRFGNVVSMTSSIEMGFGSGLMVHGFLLNNQLTDFSFVPEHNGVAVANRIQGMKRPRSSMTPTVVFDRHGQVRLVLGSPGGSRIISYVAWAMLAYLDGGYSLQAALDLGHVTNQNGETELESGTDVAAYAMPLRARGHAVTRRTLDSGVHAIAREDGRWVAAADGRREGLALAR